MVVDIFPAIDIPVVAVVWNYPGLSRRGHGAPRGAASASAPSRRRSTASSASSRSRSPASACSRSTSSRARTSAPRSPRSRRCRRTILRIAPPGMQPPSVIQFNASNVPVAQMTRLERQTLPEQKIFDYGLNFIRVRLFTIPGLSTPAPFGGKQRQIIVDIDPQRAGGQGAVAERRGHRAARRRTSSCPAGTARIGETRVQRACSTRARRRSSEFSQHPDQGRGRPAGAARRRGARSPTASPSRTTSCASTASAPTYLAILKHADASTLAVVDATRDALPAIKAAAPDGLELKLDFDQSLFVRGAIKGVLREAVVSSLLVSLMILAFLGSWRSAWSSSAPRSRSRSSPRSSGSSSTGQTHQHHDARRAGAGHRHAGRRRHRRGREHPPQPRRWASRSRWRSSTARSQIAVPAIVATLAICIVFFPVVLLAGPARFLFTPLALAVVFAMLASYVLSRTLVPTLARMLMRGEHHERSRRRPPTRARGAASRSASTSGAIARSSASRTATGGALGALAPPRLHACVVAAGRAAPPPRCRSVVGTDFFPTVDAGLMKLHFRAPAGTRIEETEQLVAQVEAAHPRDRSRRTSSRPSTT